MIITNWCKRLERIRDLDELRVEALSMLHVLINDPTPDPEELKCIDRAYTSRRDALQLETVRTSTVPPTCTALFGHRSRPRKQHDS